jgi:thiamine-monophosphate kinase
MLLEDVHFRRSWHDPYRLGRKSLAVSISDIASMGGIPRWSLLSLAIPPDIPLDFLDELARGYLALAAEQGVALIGGDTCASRSGLTISVTILGEQAPGLIVRRSGARPGDDIWVTGTLGDAAMGLKLLEEGLNSQNITHPPPNLPLGGGGAREPHFFHEEKQGGGASTFPPFHGEGQGGDGFDYLTSRLLDPTPRTAAGLALADSGLVTAMIDISDGLLADFGHIAEMSAVGGTLRLNDLPVSAPFCTAARAFPAFPHHLVLSGGEDYELCFTASAADREKITHLLKKCGVAGMPVGIVTSSPGVTVVDAEGARYHSENQGFNHFA